jgi:hypothetical protein
LTHQVQVFLPHLCYLPNTKRYSSLIVYVVQLTFNFPLSFCHYMYYHSASNQTHTSSW